MTEPDIAIDFAFLDTQTFGDAALTRDVLVLFVDQARRLLPTLPDQSRDRQTATSHLLKGSCLGIGATVAADLLQRYDAADDAGRQALYSELSTAFAAAEAAIEAHLAAS